MSSKRIAEELRAIGNVQKINVRINSPGGNVMSAQAIYTLLKSHPATVTIYVDGMAASAASIVAMAGDEIIMPVNTMMMIHSPVACYCGNAAEFREQAEVLDKFQETMIAVYERSGQTKEKIQEMLEAETWMTGAEAVELGFADRVVDPIPISASIEGGMAILASIGKEIQFDLSRFKKAPERLFQALGAKKLEPVAKADVLKMPEKQEPTKSGAIEEAEALTIDELKEKHPEVYAAVLEAGRTEERERIKAIEEMGIIADSELGEKAKFKEPCSAEEFAVRIVKAQAEKTKKHQDYVQADANDVPDVRVSDPEEGVNLEKSEINAIVSAFARGANGRRNK